LSLYALDAVIWESGIGLDPFINGTSDVHVGAKREWNIENHYLSCQSDMSIYWYPSNWSLLLSILDQIILQIEWQHFNKHNGFWTKRIFNTPVQQTRKRRKHKNPFRTYLKLLFQPWLILFSKIKTNKKNAVFHRKTFSKENFNFIEIPRCR